MTAQSRDRAVIASAVERKEVRLPKQTFFNLPEEKRRALVDIAIDEFGSHDYATASISRIVAKAGIAKGSLYQYFEDKKDLFFYLLDLVAEVKMSFLRETPPPDPRMGLFPYLRWSVKAGVHLQLNYPRLARVGYRAIYGALPFKNEMRLRVKEMSLQYFRQLVRQGIEQGDVDPTIDPELAAFVMNTVSLEFGFYIVEALGIDPERMASDNTAAFNVEAVERLYDELLRILEHGMGNKVTEDGHRARGTEDLRSDPRPEKEASR
jgi:AcrR family transcriptional regulator